MFTITLFVSSWVVVMLKTLPSVVTPLKTAFLADVETLVNALMLAYELSL
jgi:hypothetical protein